MLLRGGWRVDKYCKSGKTKGVRQQKKILIRGGGGKNDKIQTTEQNRQQKQRKNKTHTDLNAAPVEPCAIVWLTEPEQTGVPLLLQTDGGLPQLSTLTSSEWQILMGKKIMPAVTMKKPLYTVRSVTSTETA